MSQKAPSGGFALDRKIIETLF